MRCGPKQKNLNVSPLPLYSLCLLENHGELNTRLLLETASIRCGACQGRLSHNTGIVCANFGYQRGHFSPCRQAWHGRCYRIHPCDPFPQGLVPKRTEDLGNEEEEELEGWDLSEGERYEVDSEFKTAPPGDHLMTAFQCELCLFRNIKKRDPIPECEIDKWTSTCLRRANLDAFWSRRPNAVSGNLKEARFAMRCSRSHNIDEPLQDFQRGPFPLKYVYGAGMAINLLQRSFDPGRNSATIQWGTCRKMRSFYSNFVHATPFGTGQLASMTDGKRSTHFTASPTNTPWFIRFMDGMHERL
jgi:hypothetical protein